MLGIAVVFSSTFLAFIPKYSFIISFATGAVFPPEPAFSINTTTAISGSSYGANPANQPFTFPSMFVSTEPVFPPMSIPRSEKM